MYQDYIRSWFQWHIAILIVQNNMIDEKNVIHKTDDAWAILKPISSLISGFTHRSESAEIFSMTQAPSNHPLISWEPWIRSFLFQNLSQCCIWPSAEWWLHEASLCFILNFSWTIYLAISHIIADTLSYWKSSESALHALLFSFIKNDHDQPKSVANTKHFFHCLGTMFAINELQSSSNACGNHLSGTA